MPLALLTLLALSGSTKGAIQAEGPVGRETIRFDDGWRFLRDQETPGGAKGPFAWEFVPVAAKGLDAVPEEPKDGWRAVRLGENPLKSKDRFGLYRTDLSSGPAQWPVGAARVLDFESVDDNAAIYLNGKLLATERGYGRRFRVNLDTAWREGGPNRLVILIENTGGEGGINGGVTIELPEREEPIPAEAGPDFRDSGWRAVQLPHDYVVEGTFSPDADTGHGSLPKPDAWYRKTFRVPASESGRSAWLEFDGAYRNAEVYLNGERLGKESSGYIGFRFDIGKRLVYGGRNTLAVHLDPSKDEGWWYEGGGIYRHVWLTFADPIHLDPDSIFVRATPESTGTATIRLTAEALVPEGNTDVVKIEQRILKPNGREAAKIAIEGRTAANGRLVFAPVITIPKPELWTPDTPAMYTLATDLRRDGKLIDSIRTPFGIRSVRWDAERGFLLNGEPLKIKGTCNHQDHAGVGIAIPDRLFEWRIRRLKAMGSNAYRCSHNPPAKELLDACDRIGMLVLDETRHLGDATTPKSPPGTTFDSLSELRRMVVRDRNHPSVIAWSLYNEEGLQGTEEGARIFSEMWRVVSELDGTRQVTGADNGGYEGGIVNVAPVFGFNYNIWAYDRVHAAHPKTPLFGSETASTVSTRGEYANDPAKGYVSAYDVNHPSWAETAENAWRPIAERPWMAGAFVWTGFDYRGEPTPYGWPCISSHFGILDTCGFPKDNYWYYKAQWGVEPVVHILPHWNWAGKEGQPIDVWVHSNAEKVELFVNSVSVGEKVVPKYGHVQWTVPYEPGRLAVWGITGEKIVAREVIRTTGKPAAIRLRTSVKNLLADDEDLSPVEVEIVDARGQVVPEASNEVTFTVRGAGEVRGVGNGDPSSHEPDQASVRRAFHGRCAVFVGARGRAGAILLRASAPGLPDATLELSSREVALRRG